jgi:hypothetical protein
MAPGEQYRLPWLPDSKSVNEAFRTLLSLRARDAGSR